jgi:hypothetical protein
MGTVQRNAIVSPIQGLLVFNTDTDQLEFFNGSTWQGVGAIAAGTISNGGNGFGSAITIGSTDVNTLSLITNNVVRLTLGTSDSTLQVPASNNATAVNTALIAGSGLSGDNVGGSAKLQGGDGVGIGSAGDAIINGGQSSAASNAGAGGWVRITAGDTQGVTSANGGTVQIKAGASKSLTGGNVLIQAGNAIAGNGGVVQLTPGTTSSGTPGNIQLNGRITGTVQTLSSSGTIAGNTFLVDVALTSSPITVTLLSSSFVAGTILSIKDKNSLAASFNITLTPAGGNTINGTSSYVMSTNGAGVLLMLVGSDWQILSQTAVSSAVVIGTIDSQTKSSDGLVSIGSTVYAQTADATHPGLMSTGAQTFAGNKVITGSWKFGNYHLEPVVSTTTVTTSTLTLDLSTANYFLLSLQSNVTLTLTNPQDGAAYAFEIGQAATFTNKNVTWPASVKWPGGNAPTITGTAGGLDLINLVWDAQDSIFLGSFAQAYA